MQKLLAVIHVEHRRHNMGHKKDTEKKEWINKLCYVSIGKRFKYLTPLSLEGTNNNFDGCAGWR